MSTSTPREPVAGNITPALSDSYDRLAELALDLRWSWSHGADAMWRELDPTLWDITRNPWAVLQTVSRDRIERMLTDPVFRAKVDHLIDAKRQAMDAPAWFQQHHADAPVTCIAYFCMEFMLSESLPIYSGGLGNVAGDQLKAASDLGVPVVGIGLLYQQGYFRQVIDQDGAQQALYPYNDPGQLPITPVRQANGDWLRLEVALPGSSVWLRTWQVQVGKVKLYLLDTNDMANLPAHRGITSQLYGGGPELRLQQELVLGLGGWRLLRALGLRPEVCHLNEGHAAFAVLERARDFMQETKLSFAVALAVTRAGNLFTTHTAMEAGFDRFQPDLVQRYLGDYAERQLGLPRHAILALGRQNPDNDAEPFNMAYLAIHGSRAVNAVSQLHGTVSRHLFEPLFPGWPAAEVPIGHVTNGVHMPSWDSVAADDLWTEACGKERWRGTTDHMEQDIAGIPDSRLWAFRAAASQPLIDYARKRQVRHYASVGATADIIEAARHALDPNALTLGFARRFATYKRPNLLLHDPERLLRLLSDPKRPVQLVIAGKAHPADGPGQDLIKAWIQFMRRPEVRSHVIFISDYDMLLAEHLVQGVDVWLNTPRRPWEACGTSGMKVLVNGGLNLSELDGWWAEAYASGVGWVLGDGREHGDDPAADAADANALYDQLEYHVIPEFFTRDEHGIPTAWIARMRASMGSLTPRFSAARAVRTYTEQHYLPAAAAYRSRKADHSAIGTQIVAWHQHLEHAWSQIHFGAATVETHDGTHQFGMHIYLGELDPDTVRLDMYANAPPGGDPTCQAMTRLQPLAGATGGYAYSATIATNRPSTDFTARVVAHHEGVAVPLENARIAWHR